MFEDAPQKFRDALPRYAEAKVLVSIGPDYHGREARLAPEAAHAWARMSSAAATAGLQLLLISAFRSLAYQETILRRKREQGLTWEEILRVSAYPGFSEHHTGCAVDIASAECPELVEAFERTREFHWLATNANRFGFSMSYPRDNQAGVVFEPWHWRWRRKRRIQRPEHNTGATSPSASTPG